MEYLIILKNVYVVNTLTSGVVMNMFSLKRYMHGESSYAMSLLTNIGHPNALLYRSSHYDFIRCFLSFFLFSYTLLKVN